MPNCQCLTASAKLPAPGEEDGYSYTVRWVDEHHYHAISWVDESAGWMAEPAQDQDDTATATVSWVDGYACYCHRSPLLM